jgi:hypothetical protein
VKELIDIGVWLYDDLEEAKADAIAMANQTHKAANRYKETMYVVQDRSGNYYGPMNEAKRERSFYSCQIVYTAIPE